MSSYNFLRAVSDGLAEAIRYRTNLKRQRRENEYNYNRDLQRRRDEEAYNRQRDLQWDEEDYNIKQNREEEKTNKRIQKNLDFLDGFYRGKELNTPQQIQDFNFEAIARERPFSVALPNKDNFAQQIALEDLRQKNRIALQQMKNAARGGNGRQPRAMSEIEAFAKNPELMKNFWETKYGVRGGMPKAVKGIGSKSVAVGGSGYDKETDDLYKEFIKAKNELAKAQANSASKGNTEFAQKMVDINPELPEEQRAMMEGIIRADQAHSNNQTAKSLRSYENSVELLRQRLNQRLKPYGIRINEQGLEENIIGTKKNNISSIVSEDDDILGDIESRNPQLSGDNVTSSIFSVPLPSSVKRKYSK